MSNLRLTSISNQGGTASVPSDTVINGTAKAWVNFNGTGTVAIRAAFNVSSITDNGTGDYTVNLSTSLPDVNYAVGGACKPQSGQTGTSFGRAIVLRYDSNPTSSSFRILTITTGVGPEDFDIVGVSVFR